MLAAFAEFCFWREFFTSLEVLNGFRCIALCFVDDAEVKMRFGVVCAEFSGFFEVFEGGGIARLGVIVDAQVIIAEAEIGIERDGGFGLIDGLLRHAHLIICLAEVDEGEPG